MEESVELLFPDDLQRAGIGGQPPSWLRIASGFVPRSGDALGFDELRYEDGLAAAFVVLRAIVHCRKGAVSRVSLLLELMPKNASAPG